MMSNVSNYKEQGGARDVIGGSLDVASGGEIDIESGGAFKVGGSEISSTEFGFIDEVTAGTATASKAIVLGASKEIATITTATITTGNIATVNSTDIDAGASGTAGSVDVFPTTASKGKLTLACTDQTGDTAVTVDANAMGQATTVNLPDPGIVASYLVQSTAAITVAEADILSGATVTTAELNLLDLSAQSETITVAGAVSVTKRDTDLSAASGAYAVTLAAPDATMLGQVKVIQMTVAGNAITMVLTNVQGGTAASSASFDAENETLVLVAGTSKWTVVGQAGVTLS